MSVVAKVSRHKQNTDLMIVGVCILATAWFLYDGWANTTFIEEHTREDGTANLTLQMNRYYIPVGLGLAAVYFGTSVLRDRKRKIEATDRGLVLENGELIEYGAMRRIDKRFFDKEGHFTIEYAGAGGGGERKVKLKDRRYDNLGLLLDEVVRRTGAAPADESAAAGDPAQGH